MTLTELRDFLVFNTEASLSSIAKHFSIKAVDMQLVLDHWMKKGKIGYKSCNACSSDCASCPLLDLRGKYYWMV